MNEILEKILDWCSENIGAIIGVLTALTTIIKGGDALILSIKKAINKQKDIHTMETLNKVNSAISDLQNAQRDFEQELLNRIELKVNQTIELYDEKRKELAVKILTLPQEEKTEEDKIEPVIEEEKEEELL